MRVIFYFVLIFIFQESYCQNNMIMLNISDTNQIISEIDSVLTVRGIIQNNSKKPIALVLESPYKSTHPMYWWLKIQFEDGRNLSSRELIKARIRRASEYRTLKPNEKCEIVFTINFNSLGYENNGCLEKVKLYGKFIIQMRYKDNFKTNIKSISELTSNEVGLSYNKE